MPPEQLAKLPEKLQRWLGVDAPFIRAVMGMTRVMAKEMGDDNVGLIAAGTAFYAFASIVPILAAIVLSYGLFADPQTVRSHVEALFASLPQDAASIIRDQLTTVMTTEGGKKGFGLFVALALALYGGTKAASAIVTALNIAYEQKEARGIVRLYLLYFSIVVGAVLLVLGAIASTTVLAFLDILIPSLGGVGKFLIRLVSYALIGALAVTAGACLYRYGPNRADAKWAWLTPGSAIAPLLWLVGTALFGLYVSNFADYGATYGSLSAVIVLLTWLWLSAYVYLFGAEFTRERLRRVLSSAARLSPENAFVLMNRAAPVRGSLLRVFRSFTCSSPY